MCASLAVTSARMRRKALFLFIYLFIYFESGLSRDETNIFRSVRTPYVPWGGCGPCLGSRPVVSEFLQQARYTITPYIYICICFFFAGLFSPASRASDGSIHPSPLLLLFVV